jgi:hypothetical protein
MKDEKAKLKSQQTAPGPRRQRRREQQRHGGARRLAPPPRPHALPADDPPFDPEAFRERFMRDFINRLGFPPYCEEKACRRMRRCVGAYRTHSRSVSCYERHRERLQPIFVDTLREVLKASQAATKSEYKF